MKNKKSLWLSIAKIVIVWKIWRAYWDRNEGKRHKWVRCIYGWNRLSNWLRASIFSDKLWTSTRHLRMTDPENHISWMHQLRRRGHSTSSHSFRSEYTALSGGSTTIWMEIHWLARASETDYSDDNLAFDWLHHFIHHTKNRRADAWILLVIDGFGSHSTLLFFLFFFLNWPRTVSKIIYRRTLLISLNH